MKPITVTVTGVAASAAIPTNINCDTFNIGVGVKISATATYDVQVSYDGGTTWYNSSLAAQTANGHAGITVPCTHIRLNVTASTGSATMSLVQAGI